MTMVAACSFKDGAVIISDSRATCDMPYGECSDDRLQKIIRIAPKTALSFAGSGYLASKVAQHLRQKSKLNTRNQLIRKIAIELPRIAKHYFTTHSMHAKHGLSLILAGTDNSGKVHVYCYRSPDFKQEEIANSFTVIGSGEVVYPYLAEKFSSIDIPANDLKRKADILSQGLDSALGQYKAQYVGGLFQVILITPIGILPLQHHFLEINPVGPTNFKGMRMEKGRWIQESDGKETVLMEPHELMQVGPQEKRIYEYLPKTGMPDLQYYLSYFITCLKVERSVSDTIFHDVVSQIGSHKYPCMLQLVASLGFWGPMADKILEFRVDNGCDVKTIHSQKIGGWYYPERFEIDTFLKIEIDSPGPIFLDCMLDGKVLGRKALYFSDLTKEEPPKSKEEFEKKYQILSKRLPEEHRKLSDPQLFHKKAFLDYFVLCNKASLTQQSMILKIEGEIRAIYWKSYPVNLRLCIMSSFRLAPGKHLSEVKIKYAMTGEEHQIAKCEIENNSSCISTPIYADDLIVLIPKAGIYYVNSYIDSEFLGCVLLYAETDKPQYSYSLYKEDIERVEKGELLMLMARSQQR
jgi:hypothetical protein